MGTTINNSQKNNVKPEHRTQLTYKEWYESTKKKALLPDLTPEEQARPFAKYFYEDIPQPDPDYLAMMDKPCDPDKALYPENRNDLLNPGDLDVEIGWCQLPNGAGFIANKTIYPDITAEMIDWWFAWHPLEDLRYRIWYPPQHAGIMLSPESRKRILDQSIPMSERNWGVTHHVTEDCDNGMDNVTIHFMSPREFGFDMERFKQPNVATFAGGQGWSVPVDKTDMSITAPAMMCHFFRDTPEGLEHRTRFWLGYRLTSGKVELSLPPGVSVPEQAIQGLATHNVKEFTRFKSFLPRIYKEFGGKMEV
ncbi:DAPG hydrolase family protein [Priestia filamentosa]|uniref:DAPG hydrolase family protein n=1 Tax=Priestia filamentosa TaxID=1402861 RepID=UPI000E72F2EA|nr:hydrolase [Priestia filamentosa]RJS62848.1 hydrolase [Priestia filamentosa]